jgi:sugar/nucleoside kinase (ribokinase family)
MVLALIEPNGERLVVVWPPEDGAHHHLPQKAIHAAFWQGATWLHTSGMCLRHSPTRETILQAMKEANTKGVMVSLDLNVRNELWGFDAETRATFERAVSLSDVVLGDAKEEVCLLAGLDTAEEAARMLCDGRRSIIARMGDAGALAATPSGLLRAAGFMVDVVDTLGAGDAFDAGFIAAGMDGRDLQEAMRWGNAVAALTIGKRGARGSPNRQELSAFLTSKREL